MSDYKYICLGHDNEEVPEEEVREVEVTLTERTRYIYMMIEGLIFPDEISKFKTLIHNDDSFRYGEPICYKFVKRVKIDRH